MWMTKRRPRTCHCCDCKRHPVVLLFSDSQVAFVKRYRCHFRGKERGALDSPISWFLRFGVVLNSIMSWYFWPFSANLGAMQSIVASWAGEKHILPGEPRECLEHMSGPSDLSAPNGTAQSHFRQLATGRRECKRCSRNNEL
jgi:hypothetical protein